MHTTIYLWMYMCVHCYLYVGVFFPFCDCVYIFVLLRFLHFWGHGRLYPYRADACGLNDYSAMVCFHSLIHIHTYVHIYLQTYSYYNIYAHTYIPGGISSLTLLYQH